MKSRKSKTRTAVKLYDDEIFLQPWFLPKPLYLTFRKMLPSCQLQKLRYYFDDYGCMRCGSRHARYGHNGFCKTCGRLVLTRVILALRRRFRKLLGVPVPRAAIDRYLAALDSAHALRPEAKARRARLIQWHRTGKYAERNRKVEPQAAMPTYRRHKKPRQNQRARSRPTAGP